MTLKLRPLMEYKDLLENLAENVYQRLFLDPFLTLVNNPKKPLHARNSFKNKIFWKKIIKNP